MNYNGAAADGAEFAGVIATLVADPRSPSVAGALAHDTCLRHRITMSMERMFICRWLAPAVQRDRIDERRSEK